MAHTMKLTDILGFEKELERLERSRATVEKYARDVRAFYRWLPEGKTFEKETVIRYKLLLCERYAPASVNSMLAALRAFFACMGWQDCNVKPLRIQRRIFSRKERELSKEEYLRLVQTAERQGKRRLCLLLQILASTGIRVSEVPYITVDKSKV